MAARWLLLPLLLFALVMLASAQTNPAASGGDDWKYDVVYLKSGAPLKGLVTEKNSARVRIRCVIRNPGRPTLLINENVLTQDIDHMVLLDAAERERLKKRIDAVEGDQRLKTQLMKLDPTTQPNSSTADNVVLQPAPWPPDPKSQALVYQSAHFQLLSNSREDVVHLAALQLEHVYGAYARTLPPRKPQAKPTTILLVRSLDEYQQLLQERKFNFFNQAFYDISRNEVVCGSDLQRLSDELEKSRVVHAKLAAELEDRKTELNALYKGKVPSELLAPILAGQKEIRDKKDRNKAAFEMACERLFQRLFHEAFHAYLNNWVYPPDEFDVPLWLNEDLAQIFESAVFEAGGLRIGATDKDRVKVLRDALGHDTLLPLRELLRSSPAQFQVAHRSASATRLSDRHYLASWALSCYVTFNRKVLGTKALDEYVRALKRGTDPLLAFQEMVGKPLPEFEKDYREYLIHLEPK